MRLFQLKEKIAAHANAALLFNKNPKQFKVIPIAFYSYNSDNETVCFMALKGAEPITGDIIPVIQQIAPIDSKIEVYDCENGQTIPVKKVTLSQTPNNTTFLMG